MSVPRQRADHVVDLLGPVIGLEVERFFGGWAFVVLGTHIGMVLDTVYARVPKERRDAWRDAGHRPFSYERKDGRTVRVEAYWALPDAILDDARAVQRVLLDGDVPAAD